MKQTTAPETRSRRWRWQTVVGTLGVVAGLGFAAVVVIYFEYVQEFGQYGYLGAFLISVFGGSTIIAPLPMTPVIFALGTVVKPDILPILGPILIGICAGAGETVGGLTIYWTGHSGGLALANVRNERVRRAYRRALHWIDKRGTLTLFVLSAVINPFFYPAGLAAGATRYGLKRYIIICFLGKTIKGWTVALAGFWGLGSILRAFGVPI